MKTQEIRQKFTRFFEERGHTAVLSSSLIPHHDPTLLFTNAGMVQFKDVFLGLDQRPYSRASSVQKCLRAGGKHNDLENVGFTARHHTFFEMLGNFSFGDYFKRDAIRFAWDLLTQVFHISPEKLWITVFEEDDEAYAIWNQEVGLPAHRIARIGAKDNFWMMGDTGPCGPCTEIFYDHGEQVPGGPPGTPESEGDRYVEIWNLVFMQYNRDLNGSLSPLPKPSVDTGMGLERIAAVLQGVHDNYDIDLFRFLIQAAAGILGIKDLSSRSLRVIVDHIRSSSFLIAEGVVPGNEGRNYVLRRIIRRALRHGHKLGCSGLFFYQLVPALKEVMGEAYPELIRDEAKIMAVLKQEEEQFARTLAQGVGLFEEAVLQSKQGVISGDWVFKLYDTYGFPIDLTEDMARERNLVLDTTGFERCMVEQKERGRQQRKFNIDYNAFPKIEAETAFLGYHTLRENAEVLGLYQGNQAVSALKAGEEGIVVLSQSPFYAESGGQLGDVGMLRSAGTEFQVETTQKQGQAILHVGRLERGELHLGFMVEAEVDAFKRHQAAQNHSATHLLHAALRHVLGAHVEQKGSWVAPSGLRFDFSHPKALTLEERLRVERLVNDWIAHHYPVEVAIMDLEAAKKMGAAALFGEKYGKEVRVLKMGDVSLELCGGTHVEGTGEIGLFKVVSEGAIASGIRRIEALTSLAAKQYLENEWAQAKQKVVDLENTVKTLLKDQEAMQLQALLNKLPQHLLASAEQLGNQALIIQSVSAVQPKYFIPLIEAIRPALGEGLIFIVSEYEGRLSFIASVSHALSQKLKAGELVQFFAQLIGGKGGGKADLAQGGGPCSSDLPLCLSQLTAHVSGLISNE